MIDNSGPRSHEGEQDGWAHNVPGRAGELAVAAVLFAAGVLLAWRSAGLPLGTVALPGPGFFPLVLGIALALSALAIAGHVSRRSQASDVVCLGNRRVAIVFAGLAGVAVAFERLGAYLTLGLFMALVLVTVARASLWKVLLGAGVSVFAVWAFFKVLLGVQLPAGPF